MTDQSPDTGYSDLIHTMNRDNFKRTLRVIVSDPKRTVTILAARPSLIISALRIHLHQKRASAIRRKAKQDGRDVPVMMLISITSACNLACSGCYMKQRDRQPVPEMSPDELLSLVSQAEDLGISIIGIVGGEPLLRKSDVIALARSFPRMLFTLNTNGLLIDEAMAADLAGCHNLVPFISLEGFRKETDGRRGTGMYERLLAAFSQLNGRMPFFGCAVTVSRNNIDGVLDEAFIRTMLERGARAFIYIQYVPAEPGTEDLVPTSEQRDLLVSSMAEFNRKFPAFFIGIPGDMELFGGCLAAGRGFIHVNPYGDVEPCPLVPVSDANIRTLPLRDALQSRLLETIRQNHRSLHANGRCLLRTRREWLEGLLMEQ